MDKELPEEYVKVNEVDVKEFKRIAMVEAEITAIMETLAHAKIILWQRLAAQFDFNVITDAGSYNPESEIITISRKVKAT